MNKKNAEYMKRLLAPFVGHTIAAIVDDGDGSFGLMVTNGKRTALLWVDRDAEGNGPGWVTIEDHPTGMEA